MRYASHARAIVPQWQVMSMRPRSLSRLDLSSYATIRIQCYSENENERARPKTPAGFGAGARNHFLARSFVVPYSIL